MLKSSLPFIIGVLIGAGITRNKAVFTILISFIILMLLKNTLLSSAKNIKKSRDKKGFIVKVGNKMIEWYIDTVGRGIEKGNIIFDKGYGFWTFCFNIFLLVLSIIFFFKRNYLSSGICFISLQMFIVQNQMLRRLKYGNN